MKDVLLVDDDADQLQSMARALSPLVSPLSICGAGDSAAALSMALQEDPKVVVLDLCLNEKIGVESGFQLLQALRVQNPLARLIVLTGHGSIVHGIRALNLGAASFLEKPSEPAHVAALVKDAVSQAVLRREYEQLAQKRGSPLLEQLSGSSASIMALREQLLFIASTQQSVLILGETGTGKGLCARLIHEMSPRRSKKFIHYQPNFGGGDLVQSELFGHLKGAFTGATEARKGIVLEAHLGTLFIDELDELTPDTQIKLLDLIQEKRIRPVGADSFQSVDCRFLAATNRDIEEAISSGKIRRDLHHRIAHCLVRIPPLRERLADIPDLCGMFLRQLQEREGLNVFEVTPEALGELSKRAWPGNVRELQGMVETAAYHARFKNRAGITLEDLTINGRSAQQSGPISTSFHEQVRHFKARLIEQALDASEGNQVQAAKMLGLDRGTMRRALTRG